MAAWTKVTEERYDEMLGILPPVYVAGVDGFMVGEPDDHRAYLVTGRFQPTFAPFRRIGGGFYEGEPMTRAEFKAISDAGILAIAGGAAL
jgi:hypothetical protein